MQKIKFSPIPSKPEYPATFSSGLSTGRFHVSGMSTYFKVPKYLPVESSRQKMKFIPKASTLEHPPISSSGLRTGRGDVSEIPACLKVP
ncbi:hypothetical protein AVEN_57172-1 [Araneus ventricosus]|uniref:Uncharacterized protein n=1 Tax=Araneus ventricosus TaxID=182803 RepID=A0A4Y2KXE9_ARAVE|nr:hypothetical protein AVEN_57172-1 [Araneus ventricosus]